MFEDFSLWVYGGGFQVLLLVALVLVAAGILAGLVWNTSYLKRELSGKNRANEIKWVKSRFDDMQMQQEEVQIADPLSKPASTVSNVESAVGQGGQVYQSNQAQAGIQQYPAQSDMSINGVPVSREQFEAIRNELLEEEDDPATSFVGEEIEYSATSGIAETQHIEPQPVKPQPVEPQPVEPQPIKPQPVEPQPVEDVDSTEQNADTTSDDGVAELAAALNDDVELAQEVASKEGFNEVLTTEVEDNMREEVASATEPVSPTASPAGIHSNENAYEDDYEDAATSVTLAEDDEELTVTSYSLADEDEEEQPTSTAQAPSVTNQNASNLYNLDNIPEIPVLYHVPEGVGTVPSVVASAQPSAATNIGSGSQPDSKVSDAGSATGYSGRVTVGAEYSEDTGEQGITSSTDSITTNLVTNDEDDDEESVTTALSESSSKSAVNIGKLKVSAELVSSAAQEDK